MIPDLYKIDPYGEMLRATIAEKNIQIRELESRLAKAQELIEKWRKEGLDYPHTGGGLYAKTAVKLCANELEKALGGDDAIEWIEVPLGTAIKANQQFKIETGFGEQTRMWVRKESYSEGK